MVEWETLIAMFIISFGTAFSGVILASRLNYRYLQKLGRKDILGAILESEQAKELSTLIHQLNQFMGSEEAKMIKQNMVILLARLGQPQDEEAEEEFELPKPKKYMEKKKS